MEVDMKKIVLVGGGKKSLILELLKKNTNEKDFEIVSKEDSKNKLMLEAKKRIETDEKVFVE